MHDDTGALLERLEHELAAAWVAGDRSFIENLLDDDWTVTDPTGQVLTRRQVIEETFSSDQRQIVAMSIDDVRVRAYGSAAVVTGRTRATGSHHGEPVSVLLRFTDVFVHERGRWRIVASHGTLIGS